MAFNKVFVLLVSALLLVATAKAQTARQQELDSLEVVLFALQNRDSAKAMELARYLVKNASSDRQRFRVYQKLSEFYFLNNNTDKALASLFNAKEAAEKIGDPMLLAQAYGSIANQYSYLNLTDKARNYLNRAIAEIGRLPEGKEKHRLKALSYIELGHLDFNNDKFLSANANYKSSLAEFDKIMPVDKGTLYHYKRSLYNIGNSYYYIKNPDSAEIYLKRALAVDDPKSKGLKFYIYSTLSEVYAFRGNNKRAIDTLQAIITDPGFDNPSLQSEIYLSLSKNYKIVGDAANYARYNEKYLALLEKQRGEDMKAINTAFDAEQQGFLSSLSESRIRNRWLVVAILASIAIGACGLAYLAKKRKKERSIYQSVIAGMKRDEVPLAEMTPAKAKEPEVGPNIPPLVEVEILEKLRRFEKSEKFRNPKLTISTLAVQLKTNPTYLSGAIKKHTDKNFNSYINELRIRYICDKIHHNPEYLNYKISYLASDCGFASHSVFSTVFKNVVGISPSVFLREEEKSHTQGAKPISP